MTAALEFDDVARAYGRGRPVLDGVTFAIDAGEIVSLVGRNGSGKTTLLYLAMGMLSPQRGRVRAFGLTPTTDAVAVKRRIGYVSEDHALPTASSIAELIAFHRRVFGRWDEDVEREICERFGLRREWRISTLSTGQARAAALLFAIGHGPELLVLDEPAAGLDPVARREFLEIAIQFLNRSDAAILLSSHTMSDVERLGSRVLLLDDGRVRIDADVDRLREDYCVALLPDLPAATIDLVRHVPGVLRVRRAADAWRAVCDETPDVMTGRFAQIAGIGGVRCERVSLEDLFVELVGDDEASTVG